MGVDWRAYLPVQDIYEEDLLDVYVRDGYDRFARKADILLNDPDGTLRTRYTRGTPVRLEVDSGGGFQTQWAGFVVDPSTGENQTEIELYGHDLWLRKRNVISSYEETSILGILEDLVTRLTPLKWNPDLVNVDDNQVLSIGWKGQQLDEVVNELASYSGGEYFGATNDREFFFLKPDTQQSPRNFGPTSFIEAEFDEDSTRSINQVTVYYDEGDSAVTVDNRDSQRELSNSLQTEDNVVLDVTRSYPDIETRENARRKAEAILTGRDSIRTGTITTWEGFDVEPGQSTYVEIPEHDVDQEMRVAQTEYWWMEDETKITVAGGGSDDVIDTLVDLSDQVERIEQQGASEDAALTRFINQDLNFELDFALKGYKRTVPDDQFLLGAQKGNFGHPDVGGGYLGDQAGPWEEIDVSLGGI